MNEAENEREPTLEGLYAARYTSALTPVANELERLLVRHLRQVQRIDRISVRAKSVERFLVKAAKTDGDAPKYSDPLRQIQDQIGARVVVYHLQDVDSVAATLRELFRQVEERDLVPEHRSAFGYFGRHFIFALPLDAVPEAVQKDDVPNFFECQVKTLFQHAWSEANHDVGYKPPRPLTSEEDRLLAYAAAQAWGADEIFRRIVDAVRV